MSASGGEAVSLVESAMLLRWRAPELALLLADRAVAAAGQDRTTVLRAERLAVFALNRLGRHGEAAHRLLPALRIEQASDQLKHELQVELGQCAVALGEPTTALAAVRPVLAVGEDVAPALRGMALVVVAESSSPLGQGEVALTALDEADELFREDHFLDRDTALLLRAGAAGVRAMHHRRVGALDEAEAQARAGWTMLPGLADPEHDSGQVSGHLMLEMVLALLDRGEHDTALQEARPLLRRPVRAAAAAAVGWLRLALATRVHLAEGRHEPALALLADAVEVTQRHGVDGVLAECLEGLSHVHEVRGEFADALHCLRSARAAEARHRRMAETARYALLEHGRPDHCDTADLVDQVAQLLAESPAADEVEDHVGPDVGTPDPAPPVPPVAASPPVAIPLTALPLPAPPPAAPAPVSPPPATSPPAASSPSVPAPVSPAPAAPEVAQEEDPHPVGAPVHASAQGERRRRGTNGAPLLVSDLLPRSMLSSGRSGRRRAEDRAEELVETPAETGLADTGPSVDAAALSTLLPEEPAEQTSVLEMMVPEAPEVSAEPSPVPDAAAELNSIPELPADPDESEAGATRDTERGSDVPTDSPTATPVDLPMPEEQVGPALALAPLLDRYRLDASVRRNGVSGGAGRGLGASPDLPVSDQPAAGPPRAPAAQSGGYRSNGSNGAGADREMTRAGMGDLLAEALAAYQESAQDPLGDTTEVSDSASGAGVDGGRTVNGHDGDRPRTYGLRLAGPPVSRRPSSPSDALTDPELRLPDLTAEPLWRPPGPGRRPAAGGC